jgi:hypothetical protein
MQAEFLRDHIDSLLQLSHEVKERAISARLREMADECRIMLSVVDISQQVAALNQAALNKSRLPLVRG